MANNSWIIVEIDKINNWIEGQMFTGKLVIEVNCNHGCANDLKYSPLIRIEKPTEVK
jgi:hypothetical protein